MSVMPKAARPATIAFVLVTVFLDTLGIGLIIPVAPRLVGSFVADDIGAASRYFGILVALYALMQLVFAPVLGGLSDRFGRRPVLLISLAGAAASYLVGALAPTLGWLFLARTVSGITGASFSTANAYVADVTPPHERAQSFGLVGAVFSLGFIVGPALGGLLGGHTVRLPYFVAAGLNFVNMIYGLSVLPESLPPANRRPFSLARANPLGALRALARHPIVFGLTGPLGCGFLGQSILQSVWALHNQARFGWSSAQVGLSLMVVGFGGALVQGGLVRVIVPRLGERRALLLAMACSVLGFAAMGTADRSWMMFAFIPFLSLAALATPTAQAITAGAVGASEQGELQGGLNSLNGIAAIVGPLVGTSLLARFSPVTAVPRVPGAALFAGAALNALGLMLAMRLFARRPAEAVAVAAPPRGAAVGDE